MFPSADVITGTCIMLKPKQMVGGLPLKPSKVLNSMASRRTIGLRVVWNMTVPQRHTRATDVAKTCKVEFSSWNMMENTTPHAHKTYELNNLCRVPDTTPA